jgi:dolichol-phosphate mannosyltransferase
MRIAARDRQKSPDFTIVVPTYNERDRLGALLERVFAACHHAGLAVEVVVVDDNSADGTGVVADEWAARSPVRVIHRAAKLGLGSAVLDGFAAARTDIVGVMDADLSHPPELLPRLFRTISRGDFDIVVASRYIRGGGTAAWSLGRRLLSRIACALARPLTPVRDAMSGFFLIRRERLHGFRTSVRGFKIGLELIVRSNPRRLAEVGYVFVGRSIGASKMTIAEAAGFVAQLWQLYRDSLSAAIRRPAYVTIAGGPEPKRPAAVRMPPIGT